jgi:hypothetical protein
MSANNKSPLRDFLASILAGAIAGSLIYTAFNAWIVWTNPINPNMKGWELLYPCVFGPPLIGGAMVGSCFGVIVGVFVVILRVIRNSN